VIVQRRFASCCRSVENIPLQAERHSARRQKTVRLPTGIGVHLQTGMLFGITTESCSASKRNRVHFRPDSPAVFGDLVLNPYDFPVVPLGNICDVRDGTHDSPKYVSEGYPLVTSRNLVDGYIDLSDVNFISQADYDAVNSRSKVDKGDLIMPMIGTIGNPVLVEQEPRFAIKNVALIKFPAGAPSNIYLRALLRSHYFDYVLSRTSRGGSQKFISLGDLRSLPVPIPTNELIQRFDAQIRCLTRQRNLSQAAEDKAHELFLALQSLAFRGELLQ